MCEPISMIMMAASAAASVGGMMMSNAAAKKQKQADQYAQDKAMKELNKPRAVAAPVSRNPGATVRLGTGNETESVDDGSNDPIATSYYQKRKAGNFLGNLGKSSVTL